MTNERNEKLAREIAEGHEISEAIMAQVSGVNYYAAYYGVALAFVMLAIADPRCETIVEALDKLRDFPRIAEPLVYQLFDRVKTGTKVVPLSELANTTTIN